MSSSNVRNLHGPRSKEEENKTAVGANTINIGEFSTVSGTMMTIGLFANGGVRTISEQVKRASSAAKHLNKLAEREREDAAAKNNSSHKKHKVAVVGAGFSGITAALELNPDLFEIHVFEKQHALCPLQRDCEVRIFDADIHKWPSSGNDLQSLEKRSNFALEGAQSNQSRRATELLDSLNGRSVGTVAREFSKSIIDRIDSGCKSLHVYQSTSYLKIFERLGKFTLDASARKLTRYGALEDYNLVAQRLGTPNGTNDDRPFDVCILAIGFGTERTAEDLKTTSYWRNDDRGQVPLYSKRNAYLISGFGDGALTDLFRLKIYDYEPIRFLKAIRECLNEETRAKQWSELEASIEFARKSSDKGELLTALRNFKMDAAEKTKLKAWLRTDVKVILRMRGPLPDPLSTIMTYGSMTYNRVIFYFLWIFNGVDLEFSDSCHSVLRAHGIKKSDVLIRHGSDESITYRKILSGPLLRQITAKFAANFEEIPDNWKSAA
ncbi:MAG: hypothetical protein EOP05_00460 [Proteobacteria bacterium]|nr:MAG: hypothetical protein EOP05_00460 [Pseudomonadota bacterium]